MMSLDHFYVTCLSFQNINWFFTYLIDSHLNLSINLINIVVDGLHSIMVARYERLGINLWTALMTGWLTGYMIYVLQLKSENLKNNGCTVFILFNVYSKTLNDYLHFSFDKITEKYATCDLCCRFLFIFILYIEPIISKSI